MYEVRSVDSLETVISIAESVIRVNSRSAILAEGSN